MHTKVTENKFVPEELQNRDWQYLNQKLNFFN